MSAIIRAKPAAARDSAYKELRHSLVNGPGVKIMPS